MPNKTKQTQFTTPLTIKLYGQQYRLIVKNKDKVLKASKEVERTMNIYRSKFGDNVSNERLAVLAAMDLSERILEQEDMLERLEKQLVDLNKLADKTLSKIPSM